MVRPYAYYTVTVECDAQIDGSVSVSGVGNEPISGNESAQTSFSEVWLGNVGTFSVTAVYSGGNYCSGSSSAPVTETINPDWTTTSLTSAPNPSAWGQAVTFTANVYGEDEPDLGVPTGTITFSDGSIALGTSQLKGRTATFSTAALAIGLHSINAVYSGNGSYSSSSASLNQTVGQATTATAINSSANPSVYDQSVTLTATISGEYGQISDRSGVPRKRLAQPQTVSGSVTWSANTGCSETQVTTGNPAVAICTTSTLAIGTDAITAVYSGDNNHTGSTGTLSQVVTGIAIGKVSPASTAFGAQLVNTTSSPQRISLFNEGNYQMTVTSVATTADFAVQTNDCMNGVKPSTHCDIYVVFSPTQAGALSGTLTFVDSANNSPQTAQLTGIGESTTKTTLTTSPNPSALGQAVTLTAIVLPPDKGTPTGTVTFYDGTTSLGTIALNLSAAKLVTSGLAAGTHSLTATYSGDAVFQPSASTVVTQVVKQGLATVALESSSNPSYVDQSVTFSAAVSGSSTTPTGTVTFKEGTTILGNASLVNGQASFPTTFTKSESVSILASYSGDENYKAANSKAVKQVVEQYPTSTVVVSSLNPSVYGQAVALTATITSSGPTPTGTVTFKNGSATLGSASLSGGVGKVMLSTLAVGTLTITASYGGDTAHAKSLSPALKQVVNKATSTTTIESSVNPSNHGQTVKFTASVTSPTTTATGTVTLKDGSTVLGTGTLAAGKANYSTSGLSAGTHNITAVYGGTANISLSTSKVLVQTVK